MASPSFALFLAQSPIAPDASHGAALNGMREFFGASFAGHLLTFALVLVGASVVQILSSWIAAKVVVGTEKATLVRAATLWLLTLLAGIGVALLLAVCLTLAASTHDPRLLMLVLGGCLLLAFTIALALPARVFETDLLRSFAILALSFILTTAAHVAIDQALGRSTLTRWQPVQRFLFDSNEGRQRRLRHLLNHDLLGQIESDLDRLAEAGERARPFTERQEHLLIVSLALEKRRKTIKPGDQETLAAYEAIRQRHEELTKQMRADYAASLAAPATK